MATDSTYTLDQFLADTRATIKTKGVPAGLAEIRDHLENYYRPNFRAKNWDQATLLGP